MAENHNEHNAKMILACIGLMLLMSIDAFHVLQYGTLPNHYELKDQQSKSVCNDDGQHYPVSPGMPQQHQLKKYSVHTHVTSVH